MKILSIGQLPTEVGGNYTTGVANVVYELSKCELESNQLYIHGTNISNKKANNIKINSTIFLGYKYNIIDMLKPFVLHLNRTIKQLKMYRKMKVNPFRYYFYQVNISKLINNIKPDIIHCHGITQYMPTYYAAKNLTPIVMTFHGIFFNKENSTKLFDTSILYLKYITVLTKSMKKEAEELIPNISSKNIFTIPNGVDTQKFYYSEQERQDIRKKLNINDNKIVFITVGSIQPRKGQLRFLKYLKDFPLDYCYIIIGKGNKEREEELSDYIKQEHLEDNTRFIGYVANEDLYKFYSAADIYAHVSLSEGQALCELEASATGIKVLLNRDIIDTVVADTTRDNYCIFDFKQEQYEKVSEWIQKTYDRHSVKSFSWNFVMEQYLECYKTIIENEKNN